MVKNFTAWPNKLFTSYGQTLKCEVNEDIAYHIKCIYK